ncbi:MAG: NAD(P)-dependent oxidoreductase [Rhodocyclaceae bacterium]|jgi:nucleoside-diphosphate-sugar epimerase|nr:NAD(P)-dependent oxidoreductase [Rhodocyclaceae bacterium]
MKSTTGHTPRILITGSRGLIGTALAAALNQAGYGVQGLDPRALGESHGDIRNRSDVERALAGCVGVVHLGAVSRVIDGERAPAVCWATNVDGTRNILDTALAQSRRPWVVYASSREVYGQPPSLPATEDTPRVPVNIYGRSKVAAEDLVCASPLLTTIVRFSNVYGWSGDHGDRVVPAFARQAAEGHPLRVDGSAHTFDFTHLDDTVQGLLAVIGRLEQGLELPPLHFVTGQATTLGQLARMSVDLAESRSTIHEAPPRSYDVHNFYGDTTRAAQVLGWQAQVSIRDGLARLIRDFQILQERGLLAHPVTGSGPVEPAAGSIVQ